MRRRFLRAACATVCLFASAWLHADPAASPVYLGLDLEIADLTSTSDDAIRLGASIALEEINLAGGVLPGRPLSLMVLDNRSMPARGADNLRKFAAQPGMVAMMTGKFSPVALEQAKLLPSLEMIMLDPWAAADGIIDNGQKPNWAFRLSLSDTLAVKAMLLQVKKRGFKRVGMLLPNIAWGRSNHDAVEKALNGRQDIQLVGAEWYNWGTIGGENLLARYNALRSAGAEAIFLVANEREGEQMVKIIAGLPEAERLPILSHWGVTGGDFHRMAGEALKKVDFTVVQTYSFGEVRNVRAKRLAQHAMDHFKVKTPEQIPSAVGVAHAYDLVHLLAMAIRQAGTDDRRAVRIALENLAPFDGVVKRYAPPFTAERHEALGERDLYFARFREDGALVRVGR